MKGFARTNAPITVLWLMLTHRAIITVMPDDEQRDLDAFERHIREAVEQRARQRRGKEPERTDERSAQTRQPDRDDNPVGAGARHRSEHGPRQEERLRTIPDRQRQDNARENVGRYYEAWDRALKKAYAMRFELSPRLYERKITARNIDERLIPAADKDRMHDEAKREAVAASQTRMKDINEALPAMIDKTIEDAARYTRQRDDRIADAIRQRAQTNRDMDKDRER